MANVNDSGVAQLWLRNLETYSIDNMVVSRIILPQSDWVGFLGYQKNLENDDKTEEYKQIQRLDIFSQSDLTTNLFSLTAERGARITDIALSGLDTIAIAREDGTVQVKTLMEQRPWDDILQGIELDNQLIAENTQSVKHSQDPINCIIYVGDEYN